MKEIESAIMSGRYATACRNLEQLLSWKADSNGGITYLLGSCELARGRTVAAGEAWARIVPGSTFSERGIRGRVRLFQDSGQLATAERLINEAAQDRRNDRTALLMLLVPMYSQLGLIDEAQRLVEDRWEHLNALGEGALEPALKLVREHIELTWRPVPIESVRVYLDQAARLAKDDERVRLGQANLAIRTGAYDEAGRHLDFCQQTRPEDIPAWRARLNWGMATNRIDVVRQAVTRLTAAKTDPAQLHRINAWLASKQGDVKTEGHELELLLATDPADLPTLDRLAHVAEQDGQPARATELRRKKSEFEGLRARYEQRYERKQPIRDAVEMAKLAMSLGRQFEARGFLTVAISENPERQDLRQELQRINEQITVISQSHLLRQSTSNQNHDYR
jgi:tetratricopeptide (TPR) repeat protein